MKFRVLTRLANGDLEDCWQEDGKPVRFATEEEAQAAIDDLVDEMGYDPGDYEIEACS